MRDILIAGVDSGLTPGGILVYGLDNINLATIPFGKTEGKTEGETEGKTEGETESKTESETEIVRPKRASAVTAATVYDIASITKIAATTACMIKLVEQGVVDLHAPVASLVPELAGAGAAAMRIDQLLSHTSGFPAHRKFYERLLAGERLGAASARDALMEMVVGTELQYEPGTQSIYSDLGFITLGVIIERLTNERLDKAAQRLVFDPLGMTATCFVDLTATPAAPRPTPVAPTELCPYRGLVVGEVHDDNTHAAGGICGHAGVFATAADLEKLAQALIAAFNGDADSYFDSATVRTFATTTIAPDRVRVLGFDRPDPKPGVSQAGDLWPRDGFGHTGFTGTAMWLDPPRGRYAILLTNRVHPSREQVGIKPFRRRIFDAVISAT